MSLLTKLQTATGKTKQELQNDAKKVLAWYKENWPLAFFTPNGAQEKFIQVVNNNSMVKICSFGNGVGKTSLAINILGNIIFGSQSTYFDYPIFQRWPYAKRARYITDPKLTEEIGPIHSEIQKFWPKGAYQAIKAGKNYFSQYRANGWILDIMSYDQDVRQFEGGNMGLIIFDEPPPENIWNACASRLRLGGIILVLMTPLTHAAWFFDKVAPRHSESIVYGSIEDACREHGVRGHLDHANIEKMLAELDPEEVEARAHGRAMYLAGLIFKNFDYNVHVAKSPIGVPDGAQLWHIVDPHIDKPFAMLWGYPWLDGVFYIVNEWPHEDFYRLKGCQFGIEDYKKTIIQEESGWTVQRRIIDRHFANTRSLQTNRTLREDFSRVGFSFESSYASTGGEEVSTGIIKVRSALQYDSLKPIDTVNKPKIIISPTCKNTIKGFTRWSFDPKTGQPQDDYKDFMDCVRYALMANPKISEPVPVGVYAGRKLYGA